MKLISSEKHAKNHKQERLTGFLKIFIGSCGLLASLVSIELQASSIQSIEKIRDAAKIFLEEKQVSADKNNIEVTIGNIDSRLRLTECEHELDVFLSQDRRSTGNVTVGVSCAGPISWKIYVSAKVARYQSAWVVQRRLSKTDIVTKDDVKLQRVQLTDKRKVPLMELARLINASPKRVMPAGAIIYQDSVCLVCRGDRVTVTANNQYLSVNVEGVAMSNANLGEEIQVRNFHTKKLFSAVVVGKNQLNVNLSGTH